MEKRVARDRERERVKMGRKWVRLDLRETRGPAAAAQQLFPFSPSPVKPEARGDGGLAPPPLRGKAISSPSCCRKI